MNAINMIVDATTIATGQLAKQRNIELDVDRLTPILKSVLTDNIESIMNEWRDGVEANIGEAWLRTMVNSQAYELAGKVLAIYQ
jgi:hypothetical protein